MKTKATDWVRETLGDAPDGHHWITVFLGHRFEDFADPNAVAQDATAAALVCAADKRVVQTWRRSPIGGPDFWIRNDKHIPAAQNAVSHGKLSFFSTPSGGDDWVYRAFMKGVDPES